MGGPYAFLEGQSPKFFDEGADLPGEKVDLLGFSLENADAFGMVERILTAARDVLASVSTDFARAILWLADSLLEGILKDRVLCSHDGVELCALDFKRLNQLDFVHLMLLTFSKEKVEIGDEACGIDSKEATPAMFCAAYALRMLFNATRGYLRDSDLRDYYQMQAAVAYGLMQALNLSEDENISAAIAASFRKHAAKKGASAKLANDPTQAAKAFAIKLWPEANRRGFSAPAFHRKLTDGGHIVAPNTVRKWVTKLRKTGTC